MKAVLLITHFYLSLFPTVANKHYPKTYAPGKKKYCPLQASTLVQRSSDSCFLCLGIRFPQMLNTGHTFPGANQSVRQPPYPLRTSWLLCIGHFIVRSLDFILCILPCHCQRKQRDTVETLQTLVSSLGSFTHSPTHGRVTLSMLLKYSELFSFVCLPKEM